MMRFSGALLLAALVISPSIVSAQSAITGNYTFEISGHDPLCNCSTGGVGVASFDSAGNVTGTFTQVHVDPTLTPPARVILSASMTGTYTMNPDGTVKIDLTLPALGNTITLIAGFSANLDRFRFVQTSDSSQPDGLPTDVITGRGERI